MTAHKSLAVKDTTSSAQAFMDTLNPSSTHNAQQKKIDTARYIADLTAEMAEMAGKERLDVLAYFLSMARVEAELMARNAQD